MSDEPKEDGSCEEWLEEHGQCDLKAGHYPETHHLLVNMDHGVCWKVTWPFDEDDPDVKRYHAIAQAYEDEDNRRLAELAQGAVGGAYERE